MFEIIFSNHEMVKRMRTAFLTISCAFMPACLSVGGSECRAQNPLINSQFAADPTARVFDGRMYVYPSHDIPPVNLPTQRPDWFCMGDYHAYSSDNLVDWIDHGVILDQKDVPWGEQQAYSMWAPDCVKGKDGRYYFYFPDAPKTNDGQRKGFTVGVAISDTPYGPFKAEPQPIKGITGIDPCVLQASDGKNYIFWGGGGLLQAPLKDNMLELDGAPQKITSLPEGFKEGPFAFERNGKYYLTYPWVRGVKGEPDGRGGIWENPTECLAYAMSDSPMGPWQYKGIIMAEWPNGCWTNHHSIVYFAPNTQHLTPNTQHQEGTWLLFYHHNDYSPKFDKNRSMCCDTLRFNADGTIQEVIPTLRGVGVTDARGIVQIDRYSKCSEGVSIEYNDTLNPRQGWKLQLQPKAWVSYGSVSNASAKDADNAWVCISANGKQQLLRIADTKLRLEVRNQGDGLSELVLTNCGSQPVEVDWISMSQRQPLVPSTKGGLETGTYRNLFLEAGYSQEEIDRKLQSVFDDVFKGKNKCYFEVGKDMAYISDVKNDDVRTEGMSYGLMIAVQWNKKDIFDRLWRWTKKYMQIQDGPMKGYFRWSCKRNGAANAQGPASDGELYFITSLIFASNQWGNSGEINYLKEAQYILDAVQPHEVEMKGKDGKKTKRTVSLIDPETGLITFVPGVPFTDPSYHIPAFYEVWARYAQDGRADYWRQCAEKSREYLHRSVHPLTGLNPDYNNYDGSLMNTGHIIGDAFRYDSWRVPMNIAMDYSWSCSDQTWQQNYGHKIQNFFYGKGINDYVDQYNVDGTMPDKILKAGNYPEKLRHSIGLVATTAAASLMCQHPESYEFIDQLWNAKHEVDADGFIDVYYDALLRLFAFMHLSGNYKVITPSATVQSQNAGADTFTFEGNPLVRNAWTADPAPLVYGDRLYLYTGHDEWYEGQDQASGGKEFNITEWLCFSTKDMKTWENHGSVLRPSAFEWADTITAGVGTAWASQVIEHKGKFYYYTAIRGVEPWTGYAIGVAVSDSPTGPFVDAINKPLVHDKMTDNGARGWWNDIDPTVLVDDDGQAYLCWGNGTCFMAKLNPDMVSLDPTPITQHPTPNTQQTSPNIWVVDVPRFTEGPWLSKRNGWYYLTYASQGFDHREAIDYAMSRSITGPWKHMGQVTGGAENSFTIHPGLAEFNGKNYLFYHNAVLELDGHKGAIGRRSVCVDELKYNEDGSMQFVEQSRGK